MLCTRYLLISYHVPGLPFLGSSSAFFPFYTPALSLFSENNLIMKNEF